MSVEQHKNIECFLIKLHIVFLSGLEGSFLSSPVLLTVIGLGIIILLTSYATSGPLQQEVLI